MVTPALRAGRRSGPGGREEEHRSGLVSGECDIAVSNTYYFARAIRTNVKGVSDHIDQIGWLFPDQDGNGAHMNLSGGGVAVNAPNRENAIRFLEYLTTEKAQEYFSMGNDEYPAVPGAKQSEAITSLGTGFKADDVSLSKVATNLPVAQRIFDEVGWK